MKAIREYNLYEGVAENYYNINIPELNELLLSKDSCVLSVLSERNNEIFKIKVYVEEKDSKEKTNKTIALVKNTAPDNDGLGWKYINSLVISTGPKMHPTKDVYHAYVKIF